jgi:protein tyrosine phosphatase (PTP) superfamily phosphohydrolase (DUF442 family)
VWQDFSERIHIAFVPVGENWDKCDMDSFTETLAKLKFFVIGHCFFGGRGRNKEYDIVMILFDIVTFQYDMATFQV